MTETAIFSGKEYEFDGTDIYCEGKKVNTEPIVQVTHIPSLIPHLSEENKK